MKLSAKGIYPALLFHLPRPDDTKHAELLENIREQKNILQVSFDSFVQTSKNESKTGRALKFDPVLVDLEAEADRVEICNKLSKAIDKFYVKNKKRAPS